MALYEYKCKDCGEISEFLVFSPSEKLSCKKCGSEIPHRVVWRKHELQPGVYQIHQGLAYRQLSAGLYLQYPSGGVGNLQRGAGDKHPAEDNLLRREGFTKQHIHPLGRRLHSNLRGVGGRFTGGG